MVILTLTLICILVTLTLTPCPNPNPCPNPDSHDKIKNVAILRHNRAVQVANDKKPASLPQQLPVGWVS